MKRRIQFFLLAILTGLLLHFAWPTTGFVGLIFIAFLPLLFVERQINLGEKRRKTLAIFGYSWVAFALFNLTTTMWVKNAHVSGPIATTVINGALMALVITVYHLLAKKLGYKRAMLGLPFLWICLEWFHQDWDMSFPWLDLGNAFANHVEWIQWYEFVGHMGGTLWVWVVNLFLFYAALAWKTHKFTCLKNVLAAAIIFAAPLIYSQKMYREYEIKGKPVDIVVVQPNIEAFTEKFKLPESVQTGKFLRLAQTQLDENVDYLIGPETMLGHGVQEGAERHNPSIEKFKRLIEKYPNLNIIFGASSYKIFREADKTPISIPFKNGDNWYEIYNTSYQLNADGLSQPYHKSKLVVAAEMLPFRPVLQPILGKIIVDLGGMTGTHGTQKERTVFASEGEKFKAATIICWENEFGEYCTEFVENGAEILFHITNDGWWGDSDGHRQHMHFARLRAIENRRDIARSANTGISCFINQRGDVFQQQPWATDAAIRQTMHAQSELTFYTKNGDLIARVALFFSVVLVLNALVQWRLKK